MPGKRGPLPPPMPTETQPTCDEHEPPQRRRIRLPAFLFAATCLSTLWVGAVHWKPLAYLLTYLDLFRRGVAGPLPKDALPRLSFRSNWPQGLLYMGCVLAILATHEWAISS